MVDFKGVEFRSHPRRLSRSTGFKVKPEASVALYNGEKVWVRDNVRGGLMFTTDKGKKIARKQITAWVPEFDMGTKAERDKIIRYRLSAFAEEHAEGVTTDASTTPDQNGSDTPSVYMNAESDQELLKLYSDDESVPDEAAATLIGEAKGQSDGMSSVPSSVVIKAKRTALELGINNPWCAMPYLEYAVSRAANTSTADSKKRKRSETAPPPSAAQRLYDHYIAINLCPEMPEFRKRYQAIFAKNRALFEQRKSFR